MRWVFTSFFCWYDRRRHSWVNFQCWSLSHWQGMYKEPKSNNYLLLPSLLKSEKIVFTTVLQFLIPSYLGLWQVLLSLILQVFLSSAQNIQKELLFSSICILFVWNWMTRVTVCGNSFLNFHQIFSVLENFRGISNVNIVI